MATPFVQIYDDDGRPHRHHFDETITADGRPFRVVKRLVGGGNGDLFQCAELTIGLSRSAKARSQCAMKVLTNNRANRFDRFLNEIEILTGIKHPHILPAIGSGYLDVNGTKVPWMMMELGGYNLEIHSLGKAALGVAPNGPIVGRLFKTIADQMCQAVGHLHACGYIHRDIKPANFVWTKPNAFDSVSLIDFGLAKKIDANVSGRPFDSITLDNETVGPRMLFSPELCDYAIDKSTVVDHRSDLWQLSRVLWFLATGHLSTGRPSRKADPFGGQLHVIADVMCNDDPDDRLQTMDQLRDQLNELRV